jgi:hypothetical protein
MSTGRRDAQRTQLLEFGRKALEQIMQGGSQRKVAARTSKSLGYVNRAVRAAERATGILRVRLPAPRSHRLEARRATLLAYGRSAVLALAQGRTMRDLVQTDGRSLTYVYRAVAAAERADGAVPRRTRTDPLLL